MSLLFNQSNSSENIIVTDENGKEHWQCKLGYSELTDAGVEVDETEESLCSDRTDRENTPRNFLPTNYSWPD